MGRWGLTDDPLCCRSRGEGGWSAKGCELVSRNSSHITCQCIHTSSLAVLMDISKREVRTTPHAADGPWAGLPNQGSIG